MDTIFIFAMVFIQIIIVCISFYFWWNARNIAQENLEKDLQFIKECNKTTAQLAYEVLQEERNKIFSFNEEKAFKQLWVVLNMDCLYWITK